MKLPDSLATLIGLAAIAVVLVLVVIAYRAGCEDTRRQYEFYGETSAGFAQPVIIPR